MADHRADLTVGHQHYSRRNFSFKPAAMFPRLLELLHLSSWILRLTQTPLRQSAVDDVQRAFLDVERGFPDSFGQGGVGMTSAADVFGAAAEFNY